MEFTATPTISGDRIDLFRLSRQWYSDVYLGWLNDPEVQQYSRRRGRVTTEADAKSFLEYVETCADYHFAMVVRATGAHIGNMSLNHVDETNKSAEVSIMIGDRSSWGQGYASEIITLASRYGFRELGLHRLWAESFNPAFQRTMQKLGWTQEGVKRESVLVDTVYHDMVCWSLLATEFHQ